MNVLFITIVIGIVILWSAWGYFASNVEQAEYVVAQKGNGYEVRTYASHIVAETSVSGSYQEALNEGFRIIAGYIFGGNVGKQKVAMTAPVTEQVSAEKIAMTAPVTTSAADGGTRTVAFVMPKGYTLDTLPVPNDSRVKLVSRPERTMAVLRFSWYRTTARVQKKEAELLLLLKRDGITIKGTPIYAGYNAPWTPPWMVRNEVMVEIEK